MSVAYYYAKRDLTAGVAVNDLVPFAFDLSSDSEQDKMIGKEFKSIGGLMEYRHDRVEQYISMSSVPFRTPDLDAWKMFLRSCNQMEIFTFDRTGTIAAPGDFIFVRLQKGYKIQRVESSGIYKANFKIRVD